MPFLPQVWVKARKRGRDRQEAEGKNILEIFQNFITK